MKETAKTSRTAGYLEKIFRTLNADWFSGELEEPIITIQSTPRACGYVTVAKTWKRKDENRHELNLGGETLNRTIEEVVATIFHHPTYGWTITEPADELMGYILEQGWFEIDMNRGHGWTPPPSGVAKTGNGGTGAAGPKKSSTRKL